MGFDPSEDPTTESFASDSDADSINNYGQDKSGNTSDHDTENVSAKGESSDKSAVFLGQILNFLILTVHHANLNLYLHTIISLPPVIPNNAYHLLCDITKI